MSIETVLLTQLTLAAAKFLFKRYLGEQGQIVGSHGEVLHDEGLLGEAGDLVVDVLADQAKDQIKDAIDRMEAVGDIRRYALKVVRQIQSRLDQEAKDNPLIDSQGIAEQLTLTLQADLSTGLLLKHDLEPRKLVEAYDSLRPLPRGVLNRDSDLAYKRMLNHAVQCLVGVASQLPDFQPQAMVESLRRLRQLDDNVEKVLQQLARVTQEVQRLAEAGDPQRFEIEYRQAVAANLDYVELFGITIPRELRRFQLTDAFVSLNLQRSLTPTQNPARSKKRKPESPDTDEDQRDSELLSCEAVLERLHPGEGRLLIRGAAGSGKTTLMRWVAIQAANIVHSRERRVVASDRTVKMFANLFNSIAGQSCTKSTIESFRDSLDNDVMALSIPEANPHSWRKHVPFVVLLRHCPGGKLPLAEEFPTLIGEGIGTPPVDWVRTVLKDGRGLVLIDGVDEVPPDHREEVVRGLEQLTTHYPDCYFVVTTQPEAVPDGWLAHLNFREAQINPMGLADVEQFIRRWHDIAGRNLTVAGKPGDLSDKRQRLLDQLDENHALRPLSTYPLLCGSICALHLDRAGTLPETQSALCEAMCDSLLHHREREQQELKLDPFPAAYRELSVEQKRTLIQDLAVYMVEEGRSALTQSQARERLGKQLAGFRDRSASEADVVLKGLLERSGILREPVSEKVDFLHNTFKEYLAGEHFASEQSTNKLLEHVFAGTESAESWQRVTLFAAGSRSAKKEFVRELIQRLLDDPQPKTAGGKKPRRSKQDVLTDPQRLRQLLALQCQIVADGRGLTPELKGQLAALVKDLFPPRTLSDAESLAILRNEAIPYLRRPKAGKQAAKAATRCVRALRLINTPLAREAMEDYFDMDEMSVLIELAQAVNPLRLPAIREALTGVMQRYVPDEIRSRISDLTPLEGLTALTKLDLGRTQVSDISSLQGLTALTTLSLYGTPVSDVSALKGLTALTKLSLYGTQVWDVSALKGLTALTKLFLGGTQAWDVSAVKGLTALSTLDLSGTQVSDISALKGLTALTTLDLSGTPVWDVSALKGLTALTTLDLSGTPVWDVSALKGLTALTTLDLSGTPVSDVSAMKELTELDLNGTPVAALEGSLAALRRLADSELPAPVVQRMHQLGERKDALTDEERDEYLTLVSFWKSRTLEKAKAAVALQRLQEAVPDLVTVP